MQTWKKKLVVSQLALACTWLSLLRPMRKIFPVRHIILLDMIIQHHSLVLWLCRLGLFRHIHDGDIYPVINKSTVNGVISTYYLDDGVNGRANALSFPTALSMA
jgi:hypothetical protein